MKFNYVQKSAQAWRISVKIRFFTRKIRAYTQTQDAQKQLKNGDYHGIIRDCKKRHSVRKYTGKEIEQEKLDKILEAAHVAPTAANMQPVRLIVVKSKEGLEKSERQQIFIRHRLPLSSVPIRQKPGSVRLTARSQPTSMPRS